MFEINGNLFTEGSGLSNIETFQKAVLNVRGYYLARLESEFKEDIGLYVDNATSGSGATPIITPVLNQILVIKLCISSDSPEAQIAYQFAHEYIQEQRVHKDRREKKEIPVPQVHKDRKGHLERLSKTERCYMQYAIQK